MFGQLKVEILFFSILDNNSDEIALSLSFWHDTIIPISTPSGIYLYKVNNGNTRTMCEICSNLTIKILFTYYYDNSGIFIWDYYFRQILASPKRL